MAVEIRVPQLGESVVEATVARWLKKEGDALAAGDPVVELETEKVNIEVPADAAGFLAQIAHREGETVRVGEVLGVLDGGPLQSTSDGAPRDAVAPEPVASAGPHAPPAPPPPARSAVVPDAGNLPLVSLGGSTSSVGTNAAASAQVTPVARRLAEEHGIDPQGVPGSGPGGRVMKEDVLELIERAPPPAAPSPGATSPAASSSAAAAARTAAAPAGDLPSVAAPSAAPSFAAVPTPSVADAAAGRGESRVRLSRRRLTIARRLVEAQQSAAMLTTFNEIDMSAIMELRKRRRDSFKERHGVSLGFMSFFTKAAIGALKAFPSVNAELQGEELILKRYYDIGVAVSTAEGLVVPVVRDADRKTFAELEREIGQLATRARERQLTLDELRGGTFTITNGGVFGSLLSTPILNLPQVGILGMHKIEERPVAVGGQVVVRPMMYLALTYDHRIVDGREAVSFLVRIKELIEDPETLLLEG